MVRRFLPISDLRSGASSGGQRNTCLISERDVIDQENIGREKVHRGREGTDLG